MRHIVLTALLAALGCAVAGGLAKTTFAATLCVGAKPKCFSAIQLAVDAAQEGDTIELGPGTFEGGITIDKDVQLVGAGATATTIEGSGDGGPVLTIGAFSGATPPTVSIRRVTVTGGDNDSRPDTGVTAGGGVWIPQAADNATGATVTIVDSVITRNRVAPQTLIPPGPFCGAFSCAFAVGGGIDNSGRLTLERVVVSDNEVGPSIASGAFGGGIANHAQGALTIERSAVTGNRVVVTAPNGQLAVAGGISDLGMLTVTDSVVSGNVVEVEAAFPGEVNAFTGGIEVTQSATATIVRTIVRDNSVRATNAAGSVLAGAGGISTDEGVSLVLRDSAVSHNSVSVSVSSEEANAVAFGGGIEIEGDVEVTSSGFVGNDVRVGTLSGLAAAVGGGILAESVQPVAVSDSLVAANAVSSVASGGLALAHGGGVSNSGLLTLRRTLVVANRVTATGPAGVAQGGGVWSDLVPLPGFPTTVQLSLVGGAILGNTVRSSPGITVQGGGLFTASPFALSGTLIRGNSPDQCFGC
jgi:hypothetical protein